MDKDIVIFQLSQLAEKGDLSAVRKLHQDYLDFCFNELTANKAKDLTFNYDGERLRLLLDCGLDANRANDKNGLTLLMMAVRNHDVETVRCLLEHGADVDRQDSKGRTAFLYMSDCYYMSYAVFKGHKEFKDEFIAVAAMLMARQPNLGLIFKASRGEMSILDGLLDSRFCPEIQGMLLAYRENRTLMDKVANDRDCGARLEF